MQVPWAHASLPPKSISIGSAVFAVFTVVTNTQADTQADHATPSVAIAHVCTSGVHAMRAAKK